jgi:Zn-dependent M16 (insulinase) family peptidase
VGLPFCLALIEALPAAVAASRVHGPSYATSLSYIAKKLADYLFDKKVKELIKQQRSDLEQSSNNVPLLTYLSEYLSEASTAMTLDGMLTS